MKNILILNQSHTTNLGDIAIGKCLQKWAENNAWNSITFPFWDEQDVFKNISYSYMSAVVKTIPFFADFIIGKWVKKKLDSLIKIVPIDCAVIGGGELFGSHRGFNAVFSCWVNELQSRHIPCCVIGVSGDKQLNWWQTNRNKNALKKCFLVTVRDSYSKNVFKQLYDVDPELSPDVVFLFGNHKISNMPKERVVCVPVRVEGKQINGKIVESNIDYYYQLIETCSPKKKHVIFTTTEERDQAFAFELCNGINNKYGVHYEFQNYKDLDTFCTLLGKTQEVVSGRMHAMILGLLYGCIPKVVPFKEKLITFSTEYSKCDDVEKIVDETEEKFKKFAESISNTMNLL